MADSGHPPAELHERLLICRTIKLNAGAHGGHRRCCLAQMQKNAQNKPQIARLILCVHTTLQVYCNLFLTFCEVFRFLSNLDRSRFLGAGRNFRTSIGSFRFTSSWDSEVILLSQRLALKYNTIRRAGCQHFFASFFRFFRADSNQLHPLGFFRQSLLSFIMYYIRGYSIDNGLYYPAESTTSFAQIVKRFRLKFCSGNFPLFLAKATKHKM